MKPVRCAFSKIGSSDSPRRLISATRREPLSQLTPYHLWQQSVPVHELKMPRYGSWRAALKASSAALSDGGHDWTVAVSDNVNISTVTVIAWRNLMLLIVVVVVEIWKLILAYSFYTI